MPQTGVGLVPTGAVANELTAVTRRAFVPRLIVQTYYSCPSLYYLFGSPEKASGGINQVTIPVQTQSMVQGAFMGYAGGFQAPAIIPGVQALQFPLAYWGVPIILPFGENVLQASERVLSILRARMNDAGSVTYQQLATLLFQLNTANPLYPNSFVDAFDDGTNAATYGGINRTQAGNTTLKGQYINAATWASGASSVGAVGFTRASMSSVLTYITDNAGGELPSAVIMNPADFSTLNKDFIGIEQIWQTPGSGGFSADTAVRSSFPCLRVAGVAIYADHFCPKGQAFVFNTKYTKMYVSDDAAFDFTGFYSMVPVGNVSQQGIVVLGYNVLTSKPAANALLYGIGGSAW